MVCKTILVETEMGVQLAGESRMPIPLDSHLHRHDWLTAEDLKLVNLFIQKNHAALLEHWNGITSTSQFLRKLKRF